MPPTYDYSCQRCYESYIIIKSIKEYDGKDACPKCGEIGTRIISSKIHFVGAKVEDAEMNVGLGKVTKGKRHREELAKRMNVVEIGNESTDSIHKHFDSAREDARKKRYDDI